MTDLEKFKLLFDDIKVEYMEKNYNKADTVLAITDDRIRDCYNAGLDIVFDTVGNLKEFLTSGA